MMSVLFGEGVSSLLKTFAILLNSKKALGPALRRLKYNIVGPYQFGFIKYLSRSSSAKA